MFQFVIAGLRAGIRGRSFHAVILLGLALVGIAYLSGNFSPRQPKTVALDVGFSGIRFTLILLALFWIQDLLAHEIERKSILFSLAYPVSRGQYLLGRYFAVMTLVVLAASALGLCLLPAVIFAGGEYSQDVPVALGLPYWSALFGVLLDVAVVAAAATMIATVSTVSAMPLAIGVAVAIGGKALGATLDYMTRGADGDKDMVSRFGPVTEAIRWIIPDLSRLDWRNWPLYGVAPDLAALGWSAAMAATYIALALALAVLAFGRRDFS